LSACNVKINLQEHGSTSELERDILPLLKKYNATAYLSGHDHTAQFLEQDGVAFIQQVCRAIRSVGNLPPLLAHCHCERCTSHWLLISIDIQGMGMECCYSNSHERRLPKGILKYAMVTELALLRL